MLLGEEAPMSASQRVIRGFHSLQARPFDLPRLDGTLRFPPDIPEILLDRVYGGSHRFPCSGRKQAQAKGFMEAFPDFEDGRMTNSTLISRLMGPILLLMGIGAAIGLLGEYPEAYVGVLREINNQSATIILGMFALLAGLAIVNAHNLWVSDWRVIITILGWLAIARGALSLLFPNKMYGIGETILASRSGTMIGAVIILVLGGILSWMGYRDLLKK